MYAFTCQSTYLFTHACISVCMYVCIVRVLIDACTCYGMVLYYTVLYVWVVCMDGMYGIYGVYVGNVRTYAFLHVSRYVQMCYMHACTHVHMYMCAYVHLGC